MAPPVKHSNIQKDTKNLINLYRKKYVNIKFIKALIFDPSKLNIVTFFILLGELILNIFVVHRVNYTEIDWIAYMQECEGFLNGTTDYSLLKGDTGPLVYPAGFVYIYSIFYYLTSHGQNIRIAQYIFIVIYLMQMFLVLRLYAKSRKLPPYILVISAFTSYRIHSIYVLRLFNDPIAILFLYISLNLFMDNRWTWGSFAFSIAVSVKMNILLFAPAILIFYITNLGYWKTIQQLALCAFVQVVLGAPFLITHPVEYLMGSFNLGRIFEHKWTVNYRFLDRSIFENKIFHFSLLGLHIILLMIFVSPSYKYLQSYCRLRTLEKQLQPQIDAKNKQNKKKLLPRKQKSDSDVLTEEQEKFLASYEKGLKKGASSTSVPEKHDNETEKYSIHFDQSTQLALLPIFLSNFIGIMCSRSLHYQFYVWYFHSLPYLAWSTDYSTSVKFLTLALIELAWNTYPSTTFSSLLLHGCHIFLLFGIQRKLFKTSTTKDKTS